MRWRGGIALPDAGRAVDDRAVQQLVRSTRGATPSGRAEEPVRQNHGCVAQGVESGLEDFA